MATLPDTFDEPRGSALSRLLPIVIGVVLVGLIGWFIYSQMGKVQGVKVEANKPTVMDVLPPPPPPPPPPPEPVKPPPEPSPETPSPSPEPSPKPDAPAPLTIAGPAEAGTDSFGISAGSGAGSGAPGGTGTCLGSNCGGGGGGVFSDSFYRRSLGSALQEEVERNNKVNRLVFSAEFLITVSPEGRVSKVELARSSGSGDRDKILQATLEGVRGLEAPPKGVKFPQRVVVRGRRSV